MYGSKTLTSLTSFTRVKENKTLPSLSSFTKVEHANIEDTSDSVPKPESAGGMEGQKRELDPSHGC